MYKIYMLSFPNGKKYIGCTKTSLSARSGIDGKKYIAKDIKDAILKYGWDNIDKTILKDGLNYEDAKIFEEEYINKYNTRNNDFGYNKHKGGCFSKTIKSYPHIMTPAKKKWSESLIGTHLTEEHKKKIANAHRNKFDYFICQYDLSGNLIKKWGSAYEVQQNMGISRQMICNCCLLNEVKPHTIHKCHNFIWKKEKKS